MADRHALFGIALESVLKFNAHEAMARAATIAYYTILSLVPFAMVGLVLASLVIGEGPQFDAMVARMADVLGVSPDALVAQVEAFLDARLVLTVVGVVLLVIALVPWVSAVQRGVVRAFDETRRSYLRTTLSSLLLLGMAAILILLSGVWGSLAGLVVGLVGSVLGDIPVVDATLSAALALLPALIVFVVMSVLLRAIPSQVVAFRDVWLGALVTALGFVALGFGFELYVDLFVVSNGSTSGQLGALVLLLLYVDLLAIAMLAGAEVAAATYRRRRADRPGAASEDAVRRPD